MGNSTFLQQYLLFASDILPRPPWQPPSRARRGAAAAAAPRSLRVPAARGAARRRPSLGCQQPPGTVSAPLTLHPSVLYRPALGRGGRSAPTCCPPGSPEATSGPPPPGRCPPVGSPSPAPQRTVSDGFLGLAGISEQPQGSKACRTVRIFCLHSFLLSAF